MSPDSNRWTALSINQHVVGTHLKHKPEEEHHSNTGHNVCMVLDDKLMAEHRRVLVALLSDRHVDSARPRLLPDAAHT